MIKIRQYAHGDAEKLYEIEKLCFSAPWPLTSFKSIGDADLYPVKFYIAADADDQKETGNENIAGYAGFIHVTDECQIINAAVHPSFRRRGIGEKLIKKIIEYSYGNDITTLTLEVRASNAAALNLYKKLGFYQTGIRKNYYKFPAEDAILMNKDL